MRKIVLLWFCIALTTSLIAQDTTKTYWKNGKLMSIGVQKKGIEQGHWVYYHNNGIKWTEGGSGINFLCSSQAKWNRKDNSRTVSATANGLSTILTVSYTKK